METFDAITRRVSVRVYDKRTIDRNIIEKLVDAGRRAPTARKVEPWEFVVIENKDVLARISEMAPNGSFIKDAVCCIAVFCQDTRYYLEDGVAATENILLAASDLGLGACWIAGDKKDYVRDVSDLLAVPEGIRLISLISLGYADTIPEQTRKRSLEEVIHWGKYNGSEIA